MNKTTQPYMPLFLRVQGMPVLIVGGGNVALRKAKMLSAAGAEIRVIAPDIISTMREVPGVTCACRPVIDEDLASNVRLVILATDDPLVQEKMARLCEQRKLIFNRCDVPEDGDFVTGSVIDQPPVLAAVTASGVPAIARIVRERFEKALEPALLELAGLLEEIRPRLKELGIHAERRADFFRRWASETAVDEVRRRGIDSVREEMMRCLSC